MSEEIQEIYKRVKLILVERRRDATEEELNGLWKLVVPDKFEELVEGLESSEIRFEDVVYLARLYVFCETVKLPENKDHHYDLLYDIRDCCGHTPRNIFTLFKKNPKLAMEIGAWKWPEAWKPLMRGEWEYIRKNIAEDFKFAMDDLREEFPQGLKEGYEELAKDRAFEKWALRVMGADVRKKELEEVQICLYYLDEAFKRWLGVIWLGVYEEGEKRPGLRTRISRLFFGKKSHKD